MRSGTSSVVFSLTPPLKTYLSDHARIGTWLTAALWWLAGTPWGLFALGWVALTPLLWAAYPLETRHRFRMGWRCGFVAFSLINWWIVLAVTRGAGVIGVPAFVGTVLGVLGVLLIGAIHGAMVAIAVLFWGYPLSRDMGRSTWQSLLQPLLFAAAWTLLDVVRCFGPLAHTWGALGLTQVPDVALLQLAATTGQHGLTFVCAWFAASVALWLRMAAEPKWRYGSARPLLLPVSVLMVLHLRGGAELRSARIQNAEHKALRVLLVQTATQSGEGKLDLAWRQAFLQTWKATSTRRYDLVVWPETTFRAQRRVSRERTDGKGDRLGHDIDGLALQQLNQLCWERRFSLLAGADVLDTENARSNEAILLDGSTIVQSTAKSHLVPFGERAPFEQWLPFLAALAPRPALMPGLPTPLFLQSLPSHAARNESQVNRIALGALICFESCFPEGAHELRKRGAQALFVLTNDDWFAGSEAPGQHAAMAAMRAVENRVWVAQAANGGYTFVVDRWGRFVLNSSYNTPTALEVALPVV